MRKEFVRWMTLLSMIVNAVSAAIIITEKSQTLMLPCRVTFTVTTIWLALFCYANCFYAPVRVRGIKTFRFKLNHRLDILTNVFIINVSLCASAIGMINGLISKDIIYSICALLIWVVMLTCAIYLLKFSKTANA